MQLLTRTFSRAVSNTGARKKSSTSCATNIPHDPLNASRLELESLLQLLSSLHQNSQWLLVTAYHFAAKPDYVSKLAAAATQTIEATAGHMAELETLASELKLQSDHEFEGVKSLLDIVENLVSEIEECLNKFNARREVFQAAVHCQLKIKRLDFEMGKYEDETNAPLSLVKDMEKQKRKVEQLKADFRARNAALKADVEDLLEKARPLSCQILGKLFRHESALYVKLAEFSRCMVDTDETLDEYKGDSDLLKSVTVTESQAPSSESASDPYVFLTSRLGRRLVPAPSAAQLILLTGRGDSKHETSMARRKDPPGAHENIISKGPSHLRESRASASSGMPDVDEACAATEKRPVVVPLLPLGGAKLGSESHPSPVSPKASGTAS